MRQIVVTSFAEWRTQARQLLVAGVAPAEVEFGGETKQLHLNLDDDSSITSAVGHLAKPEVRVPPAFVELADSVACHSDPQRWDVLYRVLWRIVQGERHLLELLTDDDVARLQRMQRQLRRDMHKMKAFVRFRLVAGSEPPYYVAWHQPDHDIVRRVAPFFARRFRDMQWTIMTPSGTAHWDGEELTFSEGLPRSAAPSGDELEDLWRTYYANIFNPARVKIRAMKREMPVRFWHTLPEAELIPDLIRQAERRVDGMLEHTEGFATTAAAYGANLTTPLTHAEFAQLAQTCQACDLHRMATQVVWGEGPLDARLVLVGEQPGDEEDRAGRPFVGPAGRLLNEALAAAGIDRGEIYVTNIVKHFKHTLSGAPERPRRLHQRPEAPEIRCCRPWFDAEWSTLRDAAVLVCLGATAARAILGPAFQLSQTRGEVRASSYSPRTMATWHPAAILRSPNPTLRQQRLGELIQDLTRARSL